MESFNVFTPSPNPQAKKQKITPIKVFKKITENESGSTRRFIGKETKSEK